MPNVQFGDQDNYSVQLQSTDRSGASVDQVLEFKLNHAPSEIRTSTLQLSENLDIGDHVLSLSTLDSDLGDQYLVDQECKVYTNNIEAPKYIGRVRNGQIIVD